MKPHHWFVRQLNSRGHNVVTKFVAVVVVDYIRHRSTNGNKQIAASEPGIHANTCMKMVLR
jgi:hypothetical protein